MSLSHGSKGPPFAWITSNRCETALEEQHHTIHHTLAVDPMPGEKIPGQPASLFGRLNRFKSVVAPTDVARKNIGCSIKSRWIKRPAGLREASWPDFFKPRAHPSHRSYATEVPTYKPRIGSSTDLQSTINSSPHLTSKAWRIEASLRRSVALLIS